MIISFTGHRLDKLPNKEIGYQENNYVKKYVAIELKKILLELKPDKCISGFALGFDQWAAEICIELNIPFIAAIPFIGQEKIWPQKSQSKYNELLNKANSKVIVSEGGYSPRKMNIRNEWMVNNSDVVVGCYNGDSTGGTANCINYAESKQKQIIIINPNLAPK